MAAKKPSSAKARKQARPTKGSKKAPAAPAGRKKASPAPAARKRATPARPRRPSARQLGKTVEDYIAALPPWQAEVVTRLREIVRAAAPSATESIKWGQPVYELRGPFAYVKAFGATVNFGFWRGNELSAPPGLLVGDGERMRHVRLNGPEDVQTELLTTITRQAAELNKKHGDPTKGLG